MIAAIITIGYLTILTTASPAPKPQQIIQTGRATYYNPGIMEQVYANRLAWGQIRPCQECVDNVALLDASDIGQRVWLQREGEEPVGPFLVIDCAAAEDREHLAEVGWVVDVPWWLARWWQMTGPIMVDVIREVEE